MEQGGKRQRGMRRTVMHGDMLTEILSWLPFHDLISPTGVSRQWRKTALSAPRLWRDLDLAGYHSQLSMELLCRYVARAKSQLRVLHFPHFAFSDDDLEILYKQIERNAPVGLQSMSLHAGWGKTFVSAKLVEIIRLTHVPRLSFGSSLLKYTHYFQPIFDIPSVHSINDFAQWADGKSLCPNKVHHRLAAVQRQDDMWSLAFGRTCACGASSECLYCHARFRGGYPLFSSLCRVCGGSGNA